MHRWEGWVATLLHTVAVAGCLGVVQLWSERATWQWDTTPDARYTLPAEAYQMVASLSEPMFVTAFVRTGVADTAAVEFWLNELARVAPALHVTILDIDREPTRARQFGVQSAPTLVLESSGRRRVVHNPRLPVLLASMSALARKSSPRVFLIQPENGATSSDSYGRAIAALRQEGFSIEPGHAGGAQLDPQSVVALFAPADSAVSVLRSHLQRGGRALVAVEPTTCTENPELVSWLKGVGVSVECTAVLDARARMVAGDPYSVVAPGLAADHPVTAALSKPVLLSHATTLAIDEPDGTSAWVLLFSSPTARVEVLQQGRWQLESERHGPFPMAGALVGNNGSRMVVVGDADFARDEFLDYLGNRDFLLNVANWLADDAAWLGPRPPERQQGIQVFFLTAAQAERLFWTFAVGEPAALALLGLAVWWRRRRA